MSTDGKYYAVAPDVNIEASEKLFVAMTVVNVGRRPVLWQGWGGKYHKKKAGKNAFYIMARGLPKMLQEGDSHSELADLGADLSPANENVKQLYVWDPAGKEWALSRKQLKQLKKETREATA
jgi:hypothetical protein